MSQQGPDTAALEAGASQAAFRCQLVRKNVRSLVTGIHVAVERVTDGGPLVESSLKVTCVDLVTAAWGIPTLTALTVVTAR